MAKINQTEKEFTDKPTNSTKAKGTFGYKAIILLLLLGALAGGGYGMQKIASLNQEIGVLKQKIDSQYDELSKRVNLTESNSIQLREALFIETKNLDTAYSNRVEQLKKDLQNQVTQLVFNAQETVEKTDLDTTESTTSINDTPRIITIEKEKTPQEVLLAAGAIIIQDMAGNSLPIEYETEVLQILAQGNVQAMNYASTAQVYAKSGIKGKNMLIKEFNDLYSALNEPEAIKIPETTQTEPETWQDKLLYWLKSAVIQKKKSKQPEFKAETDDVYELVNTGDFAEALQKMYTDTKYTKVNSPALTAWKAQAEDYLKFEGAMKGLIMNALANIRLKEMEH